MARTVDPITEHQYVDGSSFGILTDPNNTERHQEFDPLFKAPLIIDIAHHEVHEGDTFSMVASDAAAASTDTVQLYINSGDVSSPQKRMHLILNHYGSGAHSVVIIEGITFSSGGAAYTPINRRRDSAKTTAAQAARVGGDDQPGGVITYTGGTAIWTELVGAGKSVGGSARGTEEWILAPNTGYIFEIISGATSTAINISATWYEHTDG